MWTYYYETNKIFFKNCSSGFKLSPKARIFSVRDEVSGSGASLCSWWDKCWKYTNKIFCYTSS